MHFCHSSNDTSVTRDGLHPMDLEVGKWLLKHAPGVRTILAMNKSESLDDHRGYLTSAAGEAHKLGYGDPIAISAETGLGMVDLYESLLPLLEEYMLNAIDGQSYSLLTLWFFFLPHLDCVSILSSCLSQTKQVRDLNLSMPRSPSYLYS